MVKKKVKGAKRLKKTGESWVKEEVAATTGLPPQVEGQLRCYLKLSVNQVLWMVPSSPEETHIRVRWWGEPGNGTVFRPIDVKKGGRGIAKTRARYGIRSGPKQFAAYLNDMKSLVLEVLSGPHMLAIGRVQVDHIYLLAPSKPINGFFPIMSADNEKVGELQVSLVLESLMASYDSMSSVPTPDLSSDFYNGVVEAQPINPPRVVPMAPPRSVYSSTDDPFASPMAKKSTSKGPPRGVDGAYFDYQTIDDSAPRSSKDSMVKSSQEIKLGGTLDSIPSLPKDDLSNRSDHANQALSGQNLHGRWISHGATAIPHHVISNPMSTGTSLETKQSSQSKTSGGSDLVTELLARGNKLREAMILSTLNEKATLDDSNTDIHVPQMSVNDPVFSKVHSNGTSNQTLQDIIGNGKAVPSIDPALLGRLSLNSNLSDLDSRAIDLLLGDQVDEDHVKLLKALEGGSPSSSLLGGDDVFSDTGDPLHDNEVLDQLFYKQVESEEDDISFSSDPDEAALGGDGVHIFVHKHRRSESMASLEDPGNARPPSRSSSRRSSLTLEPTRDTDVLPSPKHTPKKRGRKLKKHRPGEQKSELVVKGSKAKMSRSRTRSRSADRSGSDMDSSRLSESSRVSFEPTPSDAEEKSILRRSGKEAVVDGLSVERLTLLGRVHVARVTLDNLVLDELLLEGTPSKSRVKGKTKSAKPPRPVKRTNTYFVEYQFPVVATSRDKYQPHATATEVTRVASKKIADRVVSFGHRSVFPVLFDGDSIEKWWKSALVFKVYVRSPAQKVPKLLGMCSIALKAVLKSETLYFDRPLEVKDRSTSSTTSKRTKSDDWPVLGTLKIGVELASDHKDFATALARTRLAEMTKPQIIPIPQPKNKPSPLSLKKSRSRSRSRSRDRGATLGTQTEPQTIDVDKMLYEQPPGQKPPPSPRRVVQQQQRTETVQEALTLHTLLLVTEGHNITIHGTTRHSNKRPSPAPKPLSGWSGRDLSTRNPYLVCRMFWCDDSVRSTVCWGTHQPQFNFDQVAPVLLTQSLLERMRNNFMIVEVWDKKTSSENDQLIGIVKLPLHQFYMSFRDRRVAGTLLRSQYPVVSIDADMPVLNPFNGTQFGTIKILLAMGTMEQVSALKSAKLGQESTVSVPGKPVNYLERQHLTSDEYQPHITDNIAEHMFEVSVEGVRSLVLGEDMIWGEADCFIQYHFPTQVSSKQQGATSQIDGPVSLKTFRTATTLCIPDPVFNDVMRHKIIMPESSPVQREILSACAGAGGGSGGVPFEVWCRFYYPNVRDQVIAKAILPLAKLCAMVTMQKRGESSVQTFSLPLCPILVPSDPDSEKVTKRSEVGLLDVTVNYKTHVVKADRQLRPDVIARSIPGAQCCISVGVIKASGLKAAAFFGSRFDAGMQYASEVGVNAYVKVKLSFLQKEDERTTRTVARSFAPDFSYHMEFPCPLLWTEPKSDAISLAEILESAEATLELWHQVPTTTLELDQQYAHTELNTDGIRGRRLVTHGGDVLLGVVTIPLVGLLTRKTGVNGWFPIYCPPVGWGKTATTQDENNEEFDVSPPGQAGLQRVVGGLELSFKFAHHEDLERVVHAGRGVGWAPDYDIEHRDWESADESMDRLSEVTVHIDSVVFPLANAMITGQSHLDRNARCYIRYKFYDKKAVVSKLTLVSELEDGYVESELAHQKHLVVNTTAPFSWYLWEERLEIQIWVTFHPDDPDKQRPRHRDKLIGSAYLDLAALADTRRRQHRISGVYPLFKPGASNLGGACIRAHVTMKPNTAAYEESEEEMVDFEPYPGSPRRRTSPRKSSPQKPHTVSHAFPVHIQVDRALHLPSIIDQSSGKQSEPNCYVSYQTAEQEDLTVTPVVPQSANPVWAHDHDTWLSDEFLTQPNKTLVFKTWHKTSDLSQPADKTCDRVLGFVSVDLAPLVSGFQHVSGWYNIMDFNGQCQGQIKISITPIQPVTATRGPADLSISEPMRTDGSFITTAAYNQFPSHLTRYSEQIITSQPQDPNLVRFSEHYENVKKFHENLQHKLHEYAEQRGETFVPSGTAGHTLPFTADQTLPFAARSNNDISMGPSKSFLVNNLRSNLEELDQITSKLKQRLVIPSGSTTQSTMPPPTTTTVTDLSSAPTQSTTTEPKQLMVDDLQTDAKELFTHIQERVHNLLGTTGTVDNDMGATGQGYKDFTLNGRTFSSSGLLSLPAWVHNNNGVVVEGESETGPSLTHTLEPLDTVRTQDTITRDVQVEHEDLENEEVEFENEDEELDEDVEGGEVVVPRPLNDVSNVFFNNSLPVEKECLDVNDGGYISAPLPPTAQSPQFPLGNSFNAQSPSVALLGPDDSWVSNPSAPYFHRLSDLDASGGFHKSVNDTLATVADPFSTLDQNLRHSAEFPVESQDDPENIGDAAGGNDELIAAALSRKSSPSYHSDVDEAVNNSSADDNEKVKSRKRLDFNSAEASENDSNGLIAHRANEESDDAKRVPPSPLVSKPDKHLDEDLLEAENPARTRRVSRTSLSPSSRSGSSRGSARKAARYRREYERHKHQSDSSDDDDDDAVYRRIKSPEVHWKSARSDQSEEETVYKRSAMSADTGGYRSDQSEDAREDYISQKFDTSENNERVISPVEGHTPPALDRTFDVENDNQETHTAHFENNDKSDDSEEYSPRAAPKPAPQPQQPRIPSRSTTSSQQTSRKTSPQSNAQPSPSPSLSPRNVKTAIPSKGKENFPENSAKPTAVPNFFLPAADLAQNMRAISTLQPTRGGNDEERAAAARQLANRLTLTTGAASARVRVQPSAEQTQRIAKIFASRFTS